MPPIHDEIPVPADVRLTVAVAGLRKTLDHSLAELRSIRSHFDRRMDRLERSVRDSLALLALASPAGPGSRSRRKGVHRDCSR